MEQARAVLASRFGYDAFRPGQEAVASALLAGRDVLAVMPTGAGKSVCYQVPGVVMDGLALVVSPLVSLMGDQVRALLDAGIRGAYLNSTLTPGQQSTVLRRALDGSPAAMLCALPAELVGDDGDAVPAAYLYAVCTAPALRGRGHCRLLLQEAEQDLKRQGIRAAVLVPAEESLFGFYARFGYRTVFTCRTETVPAARGDCSITPLTPDGWQSLRELQLYDSHLSYPPELLRWQETISRSSGAGLYRIETGDAVCCAAAERDGETLLVRELLPDCPEAAAALADKLGCREASFRTAGGTQPFGMAKSLDGTPLPQRAYLGPTFE